MKRLRILLIFMVIVCSVMLSACQNGKQQIYASYDYFGTTLKAVVYTDNDSFNSFIRQSDEAVRSIDLAVNEDIKNSDINKFNNAIDGEIVKVSALCYNLVDKAKQVYALTDGAYNPCIYYLVDLWGFSPRFSQHSHNEMIYDRKIDEDGFLPLPQQEYIDAFAALSDFDKVECYESNGEFYLVKQNSKLTLGGIDYYTRLDLGGMVKGYAIDTLTQIASDLGITKGYISYGTSSIAILENKKGDNWDLTLTNPRQTENHPTFVSLPIKNSQISSSGDYERYYEKDGTRYGHIIDAKNGMPADSGISAATVICSDATLADMLSTAFCVMGLHETLEFMKTPFCTENNIKVILTYITQDKMEIFASDIVGLQVQDERYTIKGI